MVYNDSDARVFVSSKSLHGSRDGRLLRADSPLRVMFSHKILLVSGFPDTSSLPPFQVLPLL